MKKFIVLICSVGSGLMVTGNPLAQIVPTYQTCPHTCNQIGYQNPNSYQLPNYQNQNGLNIPVLVQQNPVKNIPAVQNVPTIVQPNNNQLYPQQVMLQNQVPASVINNQIQNPLANQLSQLYMNKILSNPTIQTFLDQNSNSLYQTGADYPQLNNVPLHQHVIPNPGNTPTVVNNYFLLPPEILERDLQPSKASNEPKRTREGPKRDRDNDRRPDHDRRRKTTYEEHAYPDVERKRVRPNPPRKTKPEPIIDEEHGPLSEERERNIRRKSNGPPPDRPKEKNMQQRVTERQNDKRHEIPRHRDAPKHNEPPRSHQQDVRRPKIIIRVQPSSSENVSPVEKSEGVASYKNNRQSRDDDIIKDFREKFPEIPEEVVRKLLSYLRRQIRKQQLSQEPLYNPDVTFPLSYDELFSHDIYDLNRRRRPGRKPNKKNKSPNSDIESTTHMDITTTIPTTTERTLIDKSYENEISSEINDDQSKHVETTTNDFLETTEVNKGVIIDYYPDFTQDKTYHDGDEAFNVRNLRDNRYHYTTDRNYEPHNKNDHSKDKIVVLVKPYDKTETTTSKYEVATEIQYRTPPSLESPDFRTKQIVRQKPNDKNNSYKSSTYSDAKNPRKTDGKNHRFNKKNKPDNIQTMYAHSKVVKYGKVDEDHEENVTPVVTYYLPDNMQYEEDGKTIVVAKRIPADEFWR